MRDASFENPSWLERATAPGLLAASLLLATILINPFREMLSEDDAWAYARTVQHLLATGRYQLDAWAAANMPVQIYLAAGLSKLFGYSLSLVRCTTLALLAVGAGSFYALLRELGHTRDTASVTTLAIPASPLVLMLAFTFMSDVQFFGWLLLSLWLYVRGLRHQNARSMLLGSLAAACAIETRQFGVAIIAGLLISWLLSRRESRPAVRLMLAGLLVPLGAAGAQFYMGLRAPNFTQAYRFSELHFFWGYPSFVLLKEFVWRCSVILQYIGMSVLPLLPLMFVARSSLGSKYGGSRKLLATLTTLICAVIIASLSMSSFLTARPEAQHHGLWGLWEPLELYWMLPTQLARIRPAMRLLDLGGIVGAATLFWTGLRGLLGPQPIQRFSPGTIFLVGTGSSLLALHLAYVQLNDTYIVVFIPFALMLCVERLRGFETRKALLTVSTALSMTLILLTALWMRGEYAGQQAAWKSADALTLAGVPPLDIQAPLHWAEYHGAFDAWIAAGAPGFDPSPKNRPRGYDALHDPFYAWLRERGKEAEYRITESIQGTPPAGWQVVTLQSYRNARFAKRFVWTLKRSPTP
jgi:Dolichyl-phosphate-mannose-protein mannosyltransferase